MYEKILEYGKILSREGATETPKEIILGLLEYEPLIEIRGILETKKYHYMDIETREECLDRIKYYCTEDELFYLTLMYIGMRNLAVRGEIRELIGDVY